MNGMWTICGTGEHSAEEGVIERRRPWVEGPPLDPGVNVPVVPCDTEAIERAAKALQAHRYPEIGWHPATDAFAVYFYDGPGPPIVVDGYASPAKAGDDIPRLIAVAVLRAAGERP